MDGGPAAAAADADAVVPLARRADLGGLLDQVREVLGWLDAELAEDALVVGHVVELEAPGNGPLLGAGAAELGAGLAVPGVGFAQALGHVVPVVVGRRMLRVLDVLVQVHDLPGRTVLPGLVGAGHEGVVLTPLAGERGSHLVEVDVLREDVVGHLEPGHGLEVVQVLDHGIGVGVFVQEQPDALALELLEIRPLGRQRVGSGGVEQDARRGRPNAQLSHALEQLTPAEVVLVVRFDQLLLLSARHVAS